MIGVKLGEILSQISSEDLVVRSRIGYSSDMDDRAEILQRKPARVLIVEDENLVALDLESTLSKLGFSVVGVVNSGELAIQSIAELKPNLVLMDILLKGKVDGIAAAEQIRRTTNIPIIFLTAHTDAPTRARAEHLDPAGYVVKPFREQELLKVIRHAIA